MDYPTRTEHTELDTRLKDAVELEIGDAKQYIDYDVGVFRDRNTSYYYGELFGNEKDGRSQVVSRDVADTVYSYMPSIMRVLFGGERVVEYVPTRSDTIEAAEQATDYVNDVVVSQDNDGFRHFHNWVLDAMVRKVGVIKWWWDDRTVLEASRHSGLSEEDLVALGDEDDVEEIEVEQTSPEGVQPKVFSATVKRRRENDSGGRARFAALPCEEFLIDRRATSIEDADLVAHRQLLTVSDLVAMGYDRAKILEHTTSGDDELDLSASFTLRNPAALDSERNGQAEESQRKVLYVEAYIRAQISEDDDDPAQLVKVCGLGTSPFVLLDWEEVDEIPFADICPYPEPHTFFGQCPADQVADLQLIKSKILRDTLDSLTLSIFPKTEVVEGQVNLQDVLSEELGAVVRTKAPGMMHVHDTPFVGQGALAMMEYMDKIREDRTKQSQASQGLDADALQSSTKAAVAATISAAQAQIELITRTFAETGVKRLFKGLLKLVIRHQDRPRTVMLRGQWVDVNPKSWDAEMDVRVNVALGAGGPEEKLAVLGRALEEQKLLLTTLGPSNPISGLKEYRYTLARMMELAGRKDGDAFFKEIPADYQPPEPQNGEGDDAKLLAEVQMADIQAKAQTEQAKLAFEQAKFTAQHELERLKITTDAQVKLAIAELQTQGKIDDTRLKMIADAESDEREAAAKLRVAEMAAETQRAARNDNNRVNDARSD